MGILSKNLSSPDTTPKTLELSKIKPLDIGIFFPSGPKKAYADHTCSIFEELRRFPDRLF